MVSHLLPSPVVALEVQFKVPEPPSTMGTTWLGGFVLLGVNEKLVSPGILSNNALPAGTIVNVTGTVATRLFDGYSVNVTSPRYVPDANVPALMTPTDTNSGVLQHRPPDGETCSQLPPLALIACTLKVKFVP